MKTAEDVKAFIEYRDSYHKELRGGVVMIFVKYNYKWITESELLQHWIDHVYQPSHPTLPSDEESRYEVTFGGHIKALISVQNGHLTVIGAVSGYGDSILQDTTVYKQTTTP